MGTVVEGLRNLIKSPYQIIVTVEKYETNQIHLAR